ncbi:hypothetical protein V7S43_013010 [Phytophthora oleae]|uniref:Uncharacterized protein n=1 Tax=Phytophthora oleae TaxID=2107226 RepID=A0ABD3F4E3_9STRA
MATWQLKMVTIRTSCANSSIHIHDKCPRNSRVVVAQRCNRLDAAVFHTFDWIFHEIYTFRAIANLICSSRTDLPVEHLVGAWSNGMTAFDPVMCSLLLFGKGLCSSFAKQHQRTKTLIVPYSILQ